MKSKKIMPWTIFLVFSLFTIIVLAADIPSDDQIAKILTTTNDSEVAQAKIAKENANSRDVKKYADHMIKDHSKSNKKSMKLAKKLSLQPVENVKSMEVKKSGEESIAKLKDLRGEEFDKAYIEMQIEEHQKVLVDLDNSLIPSAKNPKLKKMLEKTRTTVAKHLEDAKKVQTKL